MLGLNEKDSIVPSKTFILEFGEREGQLESKIVSENDATC